MTDHTTIYLDHNATTPIDPAVLATMGELATTAYANPGSRHALGRKARQVLEDARESMANHLGCSPQELIFTSGGTESINSALFGLTAACEKPDALAITMGEHPAVNQTVQILEKKGWTTHKIGLDPSGQCDEKTIKTLPWDHLKLVSILGANNETGVIQNLTQIQKLCKQNQSLIHLDALQMIGKQKINFSKLEVDALSMGAHKFNGPRGIGALILKTGVPYVSQSHGGFQEAGRRAGTEPVILAAGMAKALELWEQERESRIQKIKTLRDHFETRLREHSPEIIIHGEKTDRLPNTSNIAFPNVDGEAFLVALDLEGICCSAGSACASGSTEPSPVLLAMGIDPDLVLASIRFSLGWQNTKEEIEQAAARITKILDHFQF